MSSQLNVAGAPNGESAGIQQGRIEEVRDHCDPIHPFQQTPCLSEVSGCVCDRPVVSRGKSSGVLCESVERRYLARLVHLRSCFPAEALRKCIDFAVSSLAEGDRREKDLGPFCNGGTEN